MSVELSLVAGHRQLIRQSDFFGVLEDRLARRLIGAMTAERFETGDFLYRAGDVGDRLYVVLQGRIQVYQEDEYERIRMLELLGPCDVVGELSLFDQQPRTANVSALSDVVVAALRHEPMKQMLLDHPEIALALLAHVTRRLRRANHSITEVALLDVRARVSKAVIELATRFGHKESGTVVVDHGLSQEDLARYVGSTREMVNRALADLQSRRVLIVKPRGFVLLP